MKRFKMEQKNLSEPAPIKHLVNGVRPKLSLIIGTRNDEYMGNFKWRFETALNYLGNNLQKIGRLNDTEVVITDWGSEVPLHTVLSLNPAAKQIVRFVIVPPVLARDLQGDSEFPIVLAQNAAIQRSRGEYIAQTDSDILFTAEFLEGLFEILDGCQSIGVPINRALIIAKRRHVPWRYVSRSPNLQELDWFIHHLERYLPGDFHTEFGFAATGFGMMHRTLWKECRGYDERLIHWGWMEIDLGLRITRKYPWVDLRKAGLIVFHMEHYALLTGRRPTRKRNPTKRNNLYCPNDDTWGFSQHPLQEFTYSVDEDNVDSGGQSREQRIRLTCGLAFIIAYVVLAAALRPLVPKRMALFLPIWRERIGIIQSKLQGQPLHCWPATLWMLWRQRQLRRRGKSTK